MAIKIHHGPNGSYKTSGAIQDDAIPALKAGRLIVTNVRGFTLERVLQAMPELPESVNILNLDLESLADMEKMRTWFQWAPRGAFIIFDETQLIFPKAWREKDLERFDFPGGPEAAAAADRPMSWLDGWTRHRHWNWDIVLTTPNISYIRDDIRMTCEAAYRHSNLAVIGIKGRYKESQHDAQTNKPPLEGTIIEYKRIKPKTFELYQSTATGIAQDTSAGKSLLRSPKLLFLLAFMAAGTFALLSFGGVSFVAPSVSESAKKSLSDSAPPSGVASSAPVPISFNGVAGGEIIKPSVKDHPLAPRHFELRGTLRAERDGKAVVMGRLAVLDDAGAGFDQSFDDLKALGYGVFYRSPCYVQITHPLGFDGFATCPNRSTSPAPASAVSAASLNSYSSAVSGLDPRSSFDASTSVRQVPVNVVPNSEYSSRVWRGK